MVEKWQASVYSIKYKKTPENTFLGQPIAQYSSNEENKDINDTQELHLLPVFLQGYFLTI